MPPKRELEFTIDLKLGTETILRTPYRIDPVVRGFENAIEGVVGPRTYTPKCVTVGYAYYLHIEEEWVMDTLH